MTCNELDEAFWQAYRQASPMKWVYVERKTPPDMMAGPVDEDGWFPWRMLRCEDGLDDVFERYTDAAGTNLPPRFREWYASMYTLDMDCGVVRLPDNPSNSPGRGLLEHVLKGNAFWERPLELGLLPFGDEGILDAGPLCFKIIADAPSDDWPVCFWDHDCQPGKEVGDVIFSSFDALLRAVTAFLSTTDDDEANAALLATDPTGAGSTGRDYWKTGLLH